ncbi:hypothetical protein [Vulcanisaeta distributa]|uniref:hypothetical protein n=1 Tax=Vulcanisaeta distributa TaxID=164451 RepID=UPI001FB35B0D|nr:hypothetical protein [Vulcanisaeta distributa]
MQYLGLLIVIAAWFVIVGIIYLLRRLGINVPVKVYYGVFIMLKDEELVKEVIAPLGNVLRKVPGWLIILLTVGLFSVSMFVIVPIPLIIMSINAWGGLPSMLYLMSKNLVLMIIAMTHKLSPHGDCGEGGIHTTCAVNTRRHRVVIHVHLHNSGYRNWDITA